MPYLQNQVALKTYNTFGLEANARYWMEVEDEIQTREFIIDNLGNSARTFILGGGSNILLMGDLDALVLKNNILGKDVIWEDENHLHLRLGAGENWHSCVEYCVEKNWGGIENLSLIPGTVGAAPIQNIGAYGVELKDVFVYLEAMDLRTGITRSFDLEACEFGYRDSIFKRSKKGTYIITRVVLQLSKKPVLNTAYGAIEAALEKMEGPANIEKVSKAVISIRQSKLPDPAKLGNAGSFFKNPVIDLAQFESLQVDYPDIPHYPQEKGVKIPAAWLIQQEGWKGKRFGNFGVHEHQPLVLVNYGGATGREIFDLSQRIMDSVKTRFGIELMREVNVI